MTSIAYKGEGAAPASFTVLTQRVSVALSPNLHVPCGPGDEGGSDTPDRQPEQDHDHAHAAYGVYERGAQSVTLDSALGFEMLRETYLHEGLHAMLAAGRLDTVLDNEASGIAEHVVGTLAPILLAFLRENPEVIEFLTEVQT